MRKGNAICARRSEAVMTGASSAGSNGEREHWRWRCARWTGRAWRNYTRARLATQRDRTVESVGGGNGAVKNCLLAGKDGTSNRAAGRIGDRNCEIGGSLEDYGPPHERTGGDTGIWECSCDVESSGKCVRCRKRG